MELVNSWVILEILEFIAYAGEMIFQMGSGPTSLQTFRATHIAYTLQPSGLCNAYQ